MASSCYSVLAQHTMSMSCRVPKDSSPPSLYCVNRRVGCQNQRTILHFELFDALHKPLFNCGSPAVKTPIAKAGMRNFGTSSDEMDDLIDKLFPDNPTADIINDMPSKASIADGFQVCQQYRYKVGLMVYMWVSPAHRGNELGDILLQLIQQECIHNQYTHLLLVHDDDGSGKLVRYYKARGFVSIDAFLSKGMIKEAQNKNILKIVTRFDKIKN